MVAQWTFGANIDRLLAVGLAWRETKDYCTAIGGRLPTAGEWEYAARGGTTAAYYGMPAKLAWFGTNSGDARHAVGAKQPLGNASAWVTDRYQNYDSEAPAIGNVQQPPASNALRCGAV